MEPAKDDFSFFLKKSGKRLIGLSGTYVDDIIRAGTIEFQRESNEATSTAFDTKPAETVPFTFTGMNVM